MSQKQPTSELKFFSRKSIPVEMHKPKVVQQLNLVPIERRLKALEESGYNTFLMETKDVFLDMLTDSGTNAMSDCQTASMFMADEAYAGSASFSRLKEAIYEVMGKKFVLPVHQGRAAENILCTKYVKEGMMVPMNYHFTTTMAHIRHKGGDIAELFTKEATKIKSDFPFKGNIDCDLLRDFIKRTGVDKVPFIRMECSTNLLGGQPFSMANLREVRKIADSFGIMVVMDASLIGENVFMVKQREAEFRDVSVADIMKEMCALAHIVYFSARKVSSSRGGAICTNDPEVFEGMKELVPLFEGFLTYGGIPLRDIESMATGLRESVNIDVVSSSPSFIEYMAKELDNAGVPVILPGGALGCHIDAMSFLSHLPQQHYPAGSLAAAYFLVSGVRGMERGTISSVRDENGNDVLSDMELLRLALPRRVFSLSHIEYAIDRLVWLHKNRELVGGIRFTHEPKIMRFFTGRLEAIGDWPQKLMAKFRHDFGNSL